jgi:ectoine hydroxylase-related dioxygenase (phytanoyl-CoA dioxygenase family)
MTPECLEHRLSPDERAFFETNGYLIVENALDAATVSRLVPAIDRIDARERTPETRERLLSFPNILHEDSAFLDLVDCATTLPKVWGILGWNIYCYHSHLDVTPAAKAPPREGRVSWHQDSMRVNDEIETHPRPRLSLKIGYYLTDVSEPDRGNTLLVPGSHLWDELDCPADGVSDPQGAEPACLRPGSALIIDRRIWHSRSPNLWSQTRKVVWMGYAYRWLRPKDEMTVAGLLSRLDPIRRQLLGAGLSANGTYDPHDDDVPLRGWLREHCPDDALRSLHGRAQSRPPALVRGKNLGRQ